MKNPKISVVLATYNAEKTLEACLRSLAEQTYSNVEILVADGASTDRTREILGSYATRIAFQISEPDRGIYDAWNKVVPRASGEWVYFIGADDELFDADVFRKAAETLSIANERIVYGQIAVVLPNGETLNLEGGTWADAKKKIRHEMTVPHQGTFHHRSLFSEFGLFDPTYKVCGDYEFLLRELKTRDARFIADLVVCKMGFGGTSSTFKNVPIIIAELSRARKANGFSPVSPYIAARWLRYYIRGGIRSVFGDRLAAIVADVYRVLTGRPRLWTRDHSSPETEKRAQGLSDRKL